MQIAHPDQYIVGAIVRVPVEAATAVRIRHHRINAQKPPRQRIIIPLLHVRQPSIHIIHMSREPDRRLHTRSNIPIRLIPRTANDGTRPIHPRHRTPQPVRINVGDRVVEPGNGRHRLRISRAATHTAGRLGT
jgi:hypothetical protein